MKHNNLELKYKSPFGAIKENTEVYFRIDTDKQYRNCCLRLWTPQNREELYPMNFRDGYYDIKINIKEKGVNWYFFIIEDYNNKVMFYGRDTNHSAGEGTTYYDWPYYAGYQITCYDKNFKVPEWFKNKLMYQIFPDRFSRDCKYKFDTSKYQYIHKSFDENLGCTQWGANNFEFYGGNIQGIINKIDYLKKLNIDVIYLNPIFKSTSNHRYDVSTYMQIDEMLGTEKDFINLCKICHRNNIKVIIDVSWNHVGDDSIYFNKYKHFGDGGAFNNVNSPYRKWFFIYPDNSYACWWGFTSLPTLNKSCVEYREHVKEVVNHWVNLGIDGFRLDVIDELPDDFLEWFRAIVKGINPELVIYGEVWDDATLKKDGNGNFRKYLLGSSQDSVMNYVLRNIIVEFISYGYGEKEIYHSGAIDGTEFMKKYLDLLNNYPIESIESSMNFLSTHDINRIISVFSNTPYVDTLSKYQQGEFIIPPDKMEIGIKRLKLAWSLLICLKGNACIFYGDETGLYGYNDPYNRKPMNWSTINYNLLEWFRNINNLRIKYPDLLTGNIKFLYTSTNVICFIRNNKYLYMLNRSDWINTINIYDRNFNISPLSYDIYVMSHNHFVKIG